MELLSEAQNPIPLPPFPHCSIQYAYSHREEGDAGRAETERRLEGQQFTKLGRKYQHDWLNLQSINSDKHLPKD